MAGIPVNVAGVPLAALNLNILNINAQQLGQALSPFIAQRSRRYTIDINQLGIRKLAATQAPNPLTLQFLLDQGNPFFNSLFYLGLDPAVRPQIINENDARAPIRSNEVVDALFTQWFFILIRGAPSEDVAVTPGSVIPNFLSAIMGLNEAPAIYARRLASFSLHNLDPAWARHVDFRAIGRECASRLGLGVAGYRPLNPFKLLRPPNPIPAHLAEAYRVAMTMANAPANWDFHSATRAPNLLTQYGPLNANLGNLALDLWDTAPGDPLQELVNQRILFQRPQRDLRATQYTAWDVDCALDPAHNIF